jgi:hypothetical protein
MLSSKVTLEVISPLEPLLSVLTRSARTFVLSCFRVVVMFQRMSNKILFKLKGCIAFVTFVNKCETFTMSFLMPPVVDISKRGF